MKMVFSTLLVLLPGAVASAQSLPPALFVQQEGKSQALELTRLDTQVRILGYVAETSTTMTFSNRTDRALEGELYFPLPEGATISGYALDIRGTMVDGVAVEKHEARRVFEDVVRQGIDPGLVEWTKGHNFRTRVFPIPARGSRTVRVQYAAELIGEPGSMTYKLPLRFPSKIHDFSLRVEVLRAAAEPKIAHTDLADFRFGKSQDGFVAQTKISDAQPARDLIVVLAEAEKQSVLVEKGDDGQTYFAIHDYAVGQVSNLPNDKSGPNLPKRIVLYWDASGSRGVGDRTREIGLVKSCLEAWTAAGAAVEVDLVLIRNAQGQAKHFSLTATNVGELAAELQKVQYDGGTQLGSIAPLPSGAAPDLCLLATDGISNFGKEEPGPLPAPLYVFSADAGANHSFLHRLANGHGGRYFNLARSKDAEVVAAIGRPAFSFLSANADAAQATDLYPRLPQPIAGAFTLVGKLTGDQAAVTVDYGTVGGPSSKRTFQVTRSQAVEGSLLRRLWAGKKLEELMASEKRNEKEIVALGKQHGLVTPFSSLLVLDTLEQYVANEIPPPKSLPQMHEEYLRRIDTLEHQRRKQRSDKIEQVVRMWRQRVDWWNGTYRYAKDFKYREGLAGGQGGGERLMNRLALPDRAAPAPAAPAPKSTGVPETVPLAAEPEPKAPQRPRPVSPPASSAPRLILSEFAAKDSPEPSHGLPPADSGRQPGIAIKAWDPDTPYLKALRAAPDDTAFAVYMKQRGDYGKSPAFFLDCAEHFSGRNNPTLALQVLSNLAELELEDATLLRVLGHRLAQTGQLELAVLTFEEVLRLRPEEPQSYRDLALVLARRADLVAMPKSTAAPGGRPVSGPAAPGSSSAQPGPEAKAAALADYVRAIGLLKEVVLKPWDGRFPEIEVIALEELNRTASWASLVGLQRVDLDPRLVQRMDVDIRIVMTWHADATDIDLWVTEPSDEKAFYGHNRTTIGGLVSSDFTGGYGPEEYMVRSAMRGMYKIEANYFGSRASRLLGPVTVQVDVFTNYGRIREQRKSLTLRLAENKETVKIGEVEF